MDTNRLSKKMAAALNDQITEEANAAQIYLSYGAWAAGEGYNGIARFLFRHAEEERNHMMKVLEYIIKRGGAVKLAAIAAPPDNPNNIGSCFGKIYEHEVSNTKMIYVLVKKCMEEEDWATWNFLQWFVKEQTEEETFAMNLVDKVKLAGNEKSGNNAMYILDRDMDSATGEVASATDVTAVNP